MHASIVLLLAMLVPGGQAQTSDRDSRGLPSTSAQAPPAEKRVDINHAALEDLIKIPGLPRSWAARIIRFRPYRARTDLLEKGIVPPEVYLRIRDYIIAHHDRK